MPIRQRPGDLGAEDARRIRAELGRELRAAREAAGLSQQSAAGPAGLSTSAFGRLERGALREPGFERTARAARAVGLRLAVRLYPTGSPVRDAAHLRLLGRLESLLEPPLAMLREVPLPADEDRRAWDAVIARGGDRARAECETRLLDVQALARRIGAKERDDPGGRVILVVARSRHNDRVLAEHREALRTQFPLDAPAIRRALREGRLPPASGVLVL